MKKTLFFLLLLFTYNLFSQKEANFWYFGENAGLDFTSGNPIPISNGALNTLEGCSSISDKDGNLLFYSDGTRVWDKAHNIMKYSSGAFANNLKGNPSSTQSALVVPNPSNSNLYYIFTVDEYDGDEGLNFYTIDISKNGGLGHIIDGPTDLSDGKGSDWSEKVTAVEGFDCDTIWILSIVNNQFYAYKIDGSGVDFNNPIKSDLNYSLRDKRGNLKVSPDGTKIAIADYTFSGNQGSGNGRLTLHDFDSKTGIVSNQGKTILSAVTDGAPYGIEFSQQSSRLYCSTFNGTNNKLFHFDLTNSDVASTKSLIHSQVAYRGGLQLAIDGKIYATAPRDYNTGTKFLDVIENPEAKANLVKYTEDSIDLGTGNATQGLPPFIQSFFSPVKILDSETKTLDLSLDVNQVCIGNSLSFEPELTGTSASTYKWTKKEDPSIIINTRKITIDNTNFGSGVYDLEMVITDNCGRLKKYNGSVSVFFVPKPVVNSIPTYEQCDIDSNPIDGITSFNLQSKEGELTNNISDVSVDFFEVSDTNFSSPITNKTNYRNTVSTNTKNHKLVVRVTRISSGCFDFGEIELKVNATSLNSYTNLYLSELDVNASTPNSIISNGSGNTLYNFDLKTNEIISNSNGAFSLSTHAFEYYSSANDAILQINQIQAPFDNYVFTNNTEIYIRISLIGTNTCSGIGKFTIYVNELPIPQGNVNPIFLCVSNPKDITQNITVDLNASTGISSDTYQWFLNGVIINGATNAIYNANTEGTYYVESYRTFANDLSNTADDTFTIGYNTFTVKESNKALIISTDLIDDKANPKENTLTIKVSGIGEYEYALNSKNLTDFKKGTENLTFTFEEVKPGLNTVFIRDINNCGIVESQKLSFIFFQRHLSPNNDGNFDTWNIQGVDDTFYKSIDVKIFNRYGKLLDVLNVKNSNGWDGRYNGKTLPANDYWYNATLIDNNDNVRKKTGNFSLIRN